MISKPEQQIITKMQDLVQLEAEYRSAVSSHERFADCEVFNSATILRDITQLNADCTCELADNNWSVELGGKVTKKKVLIKGPELHIVMAKAMIIYVRKYL